MYQVMLKPISAHCNLQCTYCYYLRVLEMYPHQAVRRIRDDVLESFVRQYLDRPDAVVNFMFQGGEPMLMGLDFFRKVLELQRRYARPDQHVTNALQTNGTLLDEQWCDFLARHNFLVGISIDGDRMVHDAYRRDAHGRGSFDRVMRGLNLLQKHGVEYNVLVLLNDRNSRDPTATYRFLVNRGVRFIQFIPCLERNPDTGQIEPYSLPPEAYGRLLCETFDLWRSRDVGQVFVQIFENTLQAHLGLAPSLCVQAPRCGHQLVLEFNGDLYACDHYVYPSHRLGNILETPMDELAASPKQQAFGAAKADLPEVCRQCEFRFACHGGCPKHRIATSPEGEPGLNYFCPAYKAFFAHSAATFRAMAEALRAGRQAADALTPPQAGAAHHQDAPATAGRSTTASSPRRPANHRPGRNDPCPCGSGRKYKNCCMRR